jgi:hypothetical protein
MIKYPSTRYNQVRGHIKEWSRTKLEAAVTSKKWHTANKVWQEDLEDLLCLTIPMMCEGIDTEHFRGLAGRCQGLERHSELLMVADWLTLFLENTRNDDVMPNILIDVHITIAVIREA